MSKTLILSEAEEANLRARCFEIVRKAAADNADRGYSASADMVWRKAEELFQWCIHGVVPR